MHIAISSLRGLQISKSFTQIIKSYEGASALLPSRQYGKPVNPENFGLTLRSIIERNDPQLAVFLGISIIKKEEISIFNTSTYF